MRKLLPLVTDVLLVIVFCAIGRRSHDEAVLAGLLRTLWPFATGLAVGWLVVGFSRWWRPADAGAGLDGAGAGFDRAGAGFDGAGAGFDGTALWPSGVVVWVSTLVGGMLLRVVSGQGTAVSFVLVAGVVLALFLLGWRAALPAVSRSRFRRRERL
ncbi:DUF3054 family protein [Nocardia sp. R6R-6]|uniref:DUF3054 family protein n=1 Tax=Nocardia sp. R6R-6 TaxID=3459303 RepID=UPI00403DBC8A